MKGSESPEHEKNRNAEIKINMFFFINDSPLKLAQLCANYGTRIIHYT